MSSNLYQHSIKLLKNEKYHIPTAELYHPVKSIDEKLCIFEACHKRLYKNEIPWQAFRNKISLDPIPNTLKNLIKLDEVLVSKIILFKKITIMLVKGEFFKIRGSICNLPNFQWINCR